MEVFKQYQVWWRIVIVTVSAVLLTSGCVEEEGSLFDPSVPPGPTPALTSITPADSSQAGVDTLVISGSEFSPVAANNIVYFNATPATLLQATATTITLKAPFVLGDSVAVRVARQGSVLLSNSLTYKLTAAIEGYGKLGQDDKANAIIVDAAGDIFVSVSVAGVGQGIKRITPDGEVNAYARDTTGVAAWNALRFGPGGYLYGARGIRAIYRFAPGGGDPPVNPWTGFPANTSVTDIDFDQNQVLWAAGSHPTNPQVFAVTQTPSTTANPFAASVRSVRVFNNYLYMAAFKDSVWKIWRGAITGTTLGTPEVYFDFSAAFGSTYVPQAITFAANGNLYIATNAPEGIVVVTPSKSVIVPYSDYQGLFGTAVRYLAWGPGTGLFAVTEGGVLLRVEARTPGAPYY